VELDFVPRSQLEQRLRDGWSLVPGHNYIRGDWAILMVAPDGVARPKRADIAATIARLSRQPRRQPMRNTTAGLISRSCREREPA
jgi:hypothetical protein